MMLSFLRQLALRTDSSSSSTFLRRKRLSWLTSLSSAVVGDAAMPMRPLSFIASSKRSEEHTSELQSLMRISYAVFCLKKKRNSSWKIAIIISIRLELIYNMHHDSRHVTLIRVTKVLDL